MNYDHKTIAGKWGRLLCYLLRLNHSETKKMNESYHQIGFKVRLKDPWIARDVLRYLRGKLRDAL